MNKTELGNAIVKELERRTLVIETAQKAGIGQSVIDKLINDYIVCLEFTQNITGGKIEIVGDKLKLVF